MEMPEGQNESVAQASARDSGRRRRRRVGDVEPDVGPGVRTPMRWLRAQRAQRARIPSSIRVGVTL
jgi:hypothetical protein